MDILYFAAASLLFGFFTDFADLLDEHGLKWFRGADILFGLGWGICGAYIILTNFYAGLFVISLVLYWLLRGKLDYPNHALAGVIVFLSAFLFFSQNSFPFYYLTVPFLITAALGYLGAYVKERYNPGEIVRRIMLLRHFVAPLVLSLMLASLYPIAASVLFMAGSKVSEIWFRGFVGRGRSASAEFLGMSLKDGACG